MMPTAPLTVKETEKKKRKPGPGRPKGLPNKHTREVKEALQTVFGMLGDVTGLFEWAKGNPDDFYKLWAKMLPMQVTGSGGGPIDHKLVVEFVRAKASDANQNT